MIEVAMRWAGGIRFEGEGVFGHTMITDGATQSGGEEAGFQPTELLLFSIASCTGVDVVRILEKQRQKLTSLEIEVKAHQNDNYPKPFHTFEVNYIARGENLNENKLAKAIELSEGKYCVVSQTMESEVRVTTSYEIIAE